MSGDCAFFWGVYMRGTGVEQRGICGECRRLVGPRFGCPPKFMTFWAPQRTLLFFVESCGITNDTLDCCVSPSFFFFYGMYEGFACCGENCICYCAIGLSFFSFFLFILSHFLLLLLILFLVMLRLLRAPCLHFTHQMEVHDHCLGRSLFFYSNSHRTIIGHIFFFTSFVFFQEMLPWLCLQRDMHRVTRILKTEATSLFLERMLYLSSNIKFVVHVDAFFWSGAHTS
ncbi:hypothetical protein ECC02_010969 [Trypanosoma cruzi]|uniref:Uncharacterized protein n=1 Tax=Trypanosoma cruzi TaxID=5693 RepID=A0A7J6XP28_TRYCR|nr:hypothetical protein ECC02_010969 [Trypanosoma cruzi]